MQISKRPIPLQRLIVVTFRMLKRKVMMNSGLLMKYPFPATTVAGYSEVALALHTKEVYKEPAATEGK